MDQNRARRKWRLVRNCLHLVIAGKLGSQVRHVSDVNLLIKEVEEMEVTHAYTSPTRFSEAVETYRSSERLFHVIARGGKEDMDEIVGIINSDPKRYIRGTNDPESAVNRKNIVGHTPLYEAALHGHLPVVRLLLDLGASPELPSCISSVLEYPLQVAARWGHSHIVEYLLKTCTLNPKQIRLAFKSARPGPSRALLKQRVPGVCRLLCCK